MQQVFAEVHQAAPSRATVLLRGESGTGKEAIARAIHFQSPRKDAAVHQGELRRAHREPARERALRPREGRLHRRRGRPQGPLRAGARRHLFLDEIGDVSAAFQAKLLRVLQEREFERVGGTKPVKVDVRLICATNRDLEKMVQRGEYRADLYYRINVVIASSCRRCASGAADIPPLVAHFLDRFNKENRRNLKITPEGMKVLTSCYWPGNVRELENCIERTATMVQGDLIRDLAFPCKQNRCLTQTLHFLDKADAVAAVAAPVAVPAVTPRANPRATSTKVRTTTRSPASAPPPTCRRARTGSRPRRRPEGERERLIWAMEQCGWVQAKAARLLRVTPRQLGYALIKHRIEVKKF